MREQFHKTKRIPKAILKTLHAVKRLVYHSCAADEFSGTITVHTLRLEWRSLQEWCAALQIEYEGEGLPSLTRKVILFFTEKESREKTNITRRASRIMETAGWKMYALRCEFRPLRAGRSHATLKALCD